MKNNAVLLLIALLWGFGFVPQKLGLDYMEAFSFNAIRFFVGGAALFIFMAFTKSLPSFSSSKDGLLPGLSVGVLLCVAAGLQQFSLGYTTVANVAFITGVYVVLVPLCLIWFGKKYGFSMWCGALVVLVGLALLSGYSSDEASLLGDFIALCGALFWALHIIALTRFSQRIDVTHLALYQFLHCAWISALMALLVEQTPLTSAWQGWGWAILNGAVVVGLAYTLQVWVMKRADPFVASIIFSLEAVFGAAAAYWFFQETLTVIALFGAVLMLLGSVYVERRSVSD